MADLSTPQTYKPVVNSRRPEFTAWLLAIILVIVNLTFPASGLFRSGGLILTIFFLFSSVILSIGNWMSQKTKLRLDEDGIWFDNGVRETSFAWKNIVRLEVYPGRFNDKIIVVSETGKINFDIVEEQNVNGKKFTASGFMDGEEILDIILGRTELIDGIKHQAQGYYYYSKE